MLINGRPHPGIIVSCDPGAHGSFAVFRYIEDGWHLQDIFKSEDWRELVGLELYDSIGVFESNHGIQGQPAGSSYEQGSNAGKSERTLDFITTKVIKVVPQRWTRAFGVPIKRSFGGSDSHNHTAQKNWTRDKAQKIVKRELPLWASDAVAIGLSYIKELNANE